MSNQEEKGFVGREFMEKTRYAYLPVSDQCKGLPQPPLVMPAQPHEVLIDLPAPDAVAVPELDLRRAIEQRVSVRRYAPQPLTLDELSYLLWCTQGIKDVAGEGYRTARTVPSAGARHAFETFVLVNRVNGLLSGLYRYIALGHKLVQVDMARDVGERVTAACLGQAFVLASGVTFIWAADVYRMAWRYGQRGYRYLHLDAGHVCQNLYLAAQSVGCGTCAIAAFEDQAMSDTLGIDGVDLFPIYVAVVGKVY